MNTLLKYAFVLTLLFAFGSLSSIADAKKVNLNTATQPELETLPGVGPVLATKIIAARPFASTADLSKVKGLGKKSGTLKDFVTVGGSEAPAPKR